MKHKLIFHLILLIFIFSSCRNNNIYINETSTAPEFDNENLPSASVKEPSDFIIGYISEDISELRSAPSGDSDLIAELYFGRDINIISAILDWYSIDFNGNVAFVKASDVVFYKPRSSEDSFSDTNPIGEALIENVPILSQMPDFPTGCESVSAVMALQYLGESITVDDFIDNYLEISNEFYIKDGKLYGPDPYEFYVGDPRTDSSFGCMSPVIEKALTKYFGSESRVKRYSNVPLENLCAKYIDHGIPVLIWTTIAMIPSFESTKWETETRGTFTWPGNEHCMLMVGYDSKYYYMNDCYKGELIAYPIEKTKIRYEELGSQAIVIEK